MSNVIPFPTVAVRCPDTREPTAIQAQAARMRTEAAKLQEATSDLRRAIDDLIARDICKQARDLAEATYG